MAAVSCGDVERKERVLRPLFCLLPHSCATVWLQMNVSAESTGWDELGLGASAGCYRWAAAFLFLPATRVIRSDLSPASR